MRVLEYHVTPRGDATNFSVLASIQNYNFAHPQPLRNDSEFGLGLDQ